MGRFIEFYGPQRLLATRVLGLHAVRLSRAGYSFTAGFPQQFCHIYISRAIKQGMTVIQVRQLPDVLSKGCKPRIPIAVWMPARIARARRLGCSRAL